LAIRYWLLRDVHGSSSPAITQLAISPRVTNQ
jgi:hypothetical protein